MKPGVSIAMATYNGARYLQAQLESFARQTRLPDELVVCDDQSLDDTLDILQKFKATAPFPVRIERNASNIGYIKNFEKAASLCEFDIVFLSDQDDVWLGDKIQEVVDEFARNDDIMVVLNDQIIVDANLKGFGTTKLGNIISSGLSPLAFITGCCSAHRRIWQELVFPIPDEALAHDNWINGIAHDLGVVSVVKRSLQLYRRHSNNTSSHFLSSGKRVSAIRRHLTFGLGDARSSWEHSIKLQHAKVRLYTSHMSWLDSQGLSSVGKDKLGEALRIANALEARVAAFSAGRVRRSYHVLNMWRRGSYAPLSGWKSALKDLLRP